MSLELSITEVSASVESDGEGGEVVQASSRQVEVRFERLQISMNQQMQQADPMVLDIDGDGFDLRPTSDGVLFDLTGDGAGEGVLTAFVSDDDALLFLDANENGLLDGGSELVGNRVEGKNGFEELSDLDDNGDDRIDSADEAWKTLRLFQDKDGNGKVGKGEVALLEDLGIAELSTRWTRNERTDEEGVIRIGDGGFERITGVQGEMRDYMFGFLEV